MYRASKKDSLPAVVGFDIFAGAREPDEILVWPCNELAVHTFLMLRTQWRVGVAGMTGLDYTAVLAVIDRLEADDPDQLFADIRLMELAALEQVAEDRKEAEKRDRHR